MKLLKVHTTNRGVEYRIEIHAYNLVMYRSLDVYQNILTEFKGITEFRGAITVTKNDFT